MHLHPASFKDPSGFLFTQDGVLYRQVRHSYAPHYDQLLSSGLYHAITVKKWLIEHEEVSTEIIDDPSAYKILKPDRLQVITYPYEWTFSQLKQAGLRTLEIMKTAMTYGMSLKDASAYNIQFRDGQPLLIDTLSFERYEPTQPWIAYRQYCQHFLYPLMLEQYVGVGCIGWMRNYLDGFPAETVARMLPFKSKWNMGALLHLHLQKRMNKKSSTQHTAGPFSPKKMNLLIDDLHRLTNSLHPGYPKQSTWSDYYGKTILGKQYLLEKERLVTHWLTTSGPVRVIDAGANDGFFSVLAARLGHEVIAIENDPVCIEQLHQRIQIEKIKGLHTVVSDLSNPSPALGFAHRERSCLTERCTGDILMALALIHHLVIGHSIPLKRLAAFFSLLAPILILEFVPKEDEKVKTMLQSRKDIFDEYDAAHMEMYFSNYYSIRKKENIIGTQRTLYWMERNTLPAT